MFNMLDNNSTGVSLGLVVFDLIRWHISSWVSVEGCSLHLFGCSAYISSMHLHKLGLSFIYHSKKQVLLNQVQSTLHLPIIRLLPHFRALREASEVNMRDIFHQP